MRPPFTGRRRGRTRADAPQRHINPLMLASVAHEIRTPMNSLIGMLELLSMTPLSAEQARLLRIARDAARAMVRVADDVLDASKIQAGRVDLETRSVDIPGLIDDLVVLLRAENTKAAVRVDADIDARLSRSIFTDPTRLRQVLLNLACNALKFTHTGHVTIRARVLEELDAAQRLRFSIADTGIGMSRESLKRAWEPFAQAGASTTRRYGGTGLGLTIARQLASRLGGRLSICSRLGRGTTAYLDITLPTVGPATLVTPVTPVTEAMPGLPSASDGHGNRSYSRFKILLADDDPTNRLMIGMQLARLGYPFDAAEDGASALAHLRRGHYDLLLTDLRMPTLDGCALASRWRELEAAGALPMPVIGLTANPLASPPHGGQNTMNDHLVKPVTLKQLSAVLHKWLIGSPSYASGWQAKAMAALRDGKVIRPNVNLDRLRRSFGGVVTLNEVTVTFVRTTQADLAALLPYVDDTGGSNALDRSCSMRLHRITGGLQVMGQHRLAHIGAALERALDTALMRYATDHCQTDVQQPALPPEQPSMSTMASLRAAIEAFGVEVTCHLDCLARQRPS